LTICGDFVVRTLKTITTVTLIIAGLADARGQQSDINDISAYYGFGEMEMIKLEWGIKDLRIADFNGDGRNDIAVANNIKAKIELLIQKESVGPSETSVAVDPNDVDINTINPPTRFDKQAVALSEKVYSLVCGDLDSDEMMDLAFYGEPKGLYVILQKAGDAEAGKPKILSWRTKKKINIDDGLLTSNALVCADLNTDGADDLALAGRDCVYIILQKEDGSLAEPVKYAAGIQLLGIEVGDINGDGINDLILVTSDTEKPLHIRFGLKTGQFGPQVQFSIERPYILELHDIDGENGEEILTVDAGSGRLICYKFAAEQRKDSDWPILFYPLTSGEGGTKRDLAIGDFDKDGLVDVVISEPGAAEIIFYRQIAGLGLAQPVKFPALTDITNLSVADFSGNGGTKTKLATLSLKEKIIGISEFENDRLSFPKPVGLVGEPLAMELADIDSDKSIDCIYISRDTNDIRSLRAIYNLAAAGKGETNPAKGKSPTSRSSEKAGEAGALPDRQAGILELKKLTSNPDGLKVVDVDQDGLQDVLIFVGYELPILVRQARKREFEVVDSPKAQASLLKDASLRSIAVADVDGKSGKELLIAEKNFARSLVFLNAESWSIVDQYNAKSTENQISAVAAFDIDGKNSGDRPAILLLDGQKGRLQILKSGEDKTYRFEKELEVGKWNAAAHLKMLFAPLTGGEAKSILIFDGEKFALITPPSSEGRRNLEQQFSYETQIKDGSYGNLAAGDINSDGQADITMVEFKRNHIEILTLDSNTKPIPAMRFKIFEEKSYRDKGAGKSGVEPREMSIADVTGDGKNDLVTIIHDRIIIYPQD